MFLQLIPRYVFYLQTDMNLGNLRVTESNLCTKMSGRFDEIEAYVQKHWLTNVIKEKQTKTDWFICTRDTNWRSSTEKNVWILKTFLNA